MSAQDSTAKVPNSSAKESTRTNKQNHVTFDMTVSKNPTDSSVKPSHSIAIDIGREEPAACPICLGDYLPGELRSYLKCRHAFCSVCLTEYLNVKVNNNEVLEIPCPQSGCKERFTKKSVKNILKSEEYKRYKELVMKKKILKDLKKTYCPQPGCSRPIKLVKAQEFSTCECGVKICNDCLKLFHEGKSCIEAIDSDFESYAKQNGVKFCMMCKTIVIRESGCNHMKCAVCDYEFCWVCGRDDKNMRHYCPGEWSPIPPASVRKDGFMWKLKKSWKEGSFSKRVWICLGLFLVSPLLLIGFVIFYPTYFMANSGVEFERRKPIKSVCIFLGQILMGLVFLPLTIMMLITQGILLGLYFVLLFPIIFLIKFLMKKYGKRPPTNPQMKTRWQSRNPENFTYRPY